MKTILLQILGLLLFTLSLQAQDVITIKHSCSFDEEETEQEFYYFGASSEADKIVEQIVDAVSIAKNFVVKSSDCKNALATEENGQRYILYNTSFLEKFKKDARTKWAAYCVLAHEIGHHLNGHDFKSTNSKLRKKMELQADIFAGGVLHKLGATLDEAKAGIEMLQNKGGSDTHPPTRARAEAIANGWKKSEENIKKLRGGEERVDPAPRPIKKKKKEEPEYIPDEPEEIEPLTTVSDQLIINKMLGTWQIDLGYNDYNQRVIIQSMLYADGSMSSQTFLNGVVSATEIMTWTVSNNIMVVMDASGYMYSYTPYFNSNDVVILTYTGSTGPSLIDIGTQLYYTRVY
ncbi:MAG: M48 family metalloprotease [Saprospiraceae bacterium]